MTSAEPAETADSAGKPDKHEPDKYDENSPDFDPPGPDWLYRWRLQVIGKSRLRQILWRVFITVVGGAIVLGGIALLPLPGPGWAVIFLGLAVLASEYVWARRLLRYTKDRAAGAANSVLKKENRGLALSLGLVAALLAAAVASWYLYRFGWSLDGPLGWLG